MSSNQSPVLMPGAYVGPGVEVHEGVHLEPGAVVLSAAEGAQPPTILESGCLIGANATVLPGITIGMRARVEPGSVVNRSVPALAIVDGNPARIVGYLEAAPSIADPRGAGDDDADRSRPSKVSGVVLNTFPLVHDLRGNLTVGEVGAGLPFKPARFFMVFDVPSAETRGAHAHLTCAQMLIAVTGSVRVVVDNGDDREEFLLDRPNLGLSIPPMVWAIQFGYSPDAVLLVLASEPYDAAEYIRDYGEFLAQKQRPVSPEA